MLMLAYALFAFGLLGLCITQLMVWRLSAPPKVEGIAFDLAFIVAAAVAKYLAG